MASLALETGLLRSINDDGQVADSGDYAAKLGLDHQLVVGMITSLGADGFIIVKASHVPASIFSTVAHMCGAECSCCSRRLVGRALHTTDPVLQRAGHL